MASFPTAPLAAIFICLGFSSTAVGQGRALAASSGKTVTPRTCTIVVNKADNSLKLYDNSGLLVGRYLVATGLYRCTVEGVFRVTDKHVISRTGGGPLGTHWIGLNTKGRRGWKQVGIHGTNRPGLIGKFASNGCVRMRNEDIAHIYPLVATGSKVQIVSTVVAAPRKPSSTPSIAAPQAVPPSIRPPVIALVAKSRSAWLKSSLELGRLLLPTPLLGLLAWVLLRSRFWNGKDIPPGRGMQ